MEDFLDSEPVAVCQKTDGAELVAAKGVSTEDVNEAEKRLGQAASISDSFDNCKETCVKSHLVITWISTISGPRPAAIVFYKSKDLVGATNQSSLDEFVALKIHENLDWLEEAKKAKVSEVPPVFQVIETKSADKPTLSAFSAAIQTFVLVLEKLTGQRKKKAIVKTNRFVTQDT